MEEGAAVERREQAAGAPALCAVGEGSIRCAIALDSPGPHLKSGWGQPDAFPSGPQTHPPVHTRAHLGLRSEVLNWPFEPKP